MRSPASVSVSVAVLVALARPSAADTTANTPPPPPPGLDFKSPLSAEDLRRKNENGYVTGLPLANFDPNTGFGFGLRLYYYWNGERRDPRFAYTPYLHRVFVQGFGTTKGLQFHWVDYDAPAFLDSPYRIRAQALFVRNKEQRFYGTGNEVMGELSYSGSAETFGKYSDYQAELDQVRADGTTLSRYDLWDMKRPGVVAGVERTFLSGLLRVLVGAGATYVIIDDYTGTTAPAVDADGNETEAPHGPTRLRERCDAGTLLGCDGGFESYARFALSLDTRDYEPDPSRGVFADLSLDAAPAVVSEYSTLRVMASARGFYSPLPAHADLVLAGRFTFQWQHADTPFFNLPTIAWTEDQRTGIGGLRSMRGFKQERFIGRVVTLANAELRWTFHRFSMLEQKFALMVVPFVDAGRVYDRLDDLSLSGWRHSQGGALRLSWNLATIIVVEYGVSDEDSGLYINFNHQF